MPGSYDTSKPWADFMSPFRLYRTVAASDADLTFTEILDLTKSVSARNNVLHVIVKQTAGAPARLKLEFFATLPADSVPAGLAGTALNVENSTFISPLQLNKFHDLIAGVYKLKVVLETAGTFEIYVSTNHNNLEA